MPAPSRSVAEAVRLRLEPGLASEAAGQLARFVVAGLGVTMLAVLVYLAAAVSLGLPALVANGLSHLVGVAVGYRIHSRWSFRAEPGQEATMVARFALVSLLPFLLNSLWVWLAVAVLALPAWAPVPAMIFVTPLASFVLNRYWVFAS